MTWETADGFRMRIGSRVQKWHKRNNKRLHGIASRPKRQSGHFVFRGRHARFEPEYVDVQGCPVPRQLAAVIRPSLAATGATLTSCYRGTDPQGAAILRAHGKHTQEQLYDGFIHHLPGFLPANRPGTSTHELRSDGVAYSGPSGRRLEWWECGMDIDDAHVDAFIAHLAKRGIHAHRPYPSGSEHHHVNLSRKP